MYTAFSPGTKNLFLVLSAACCIVAFFLMDAMRKEQKRRKWVCGILLCILAAGPGRTTHSDKPRRCGGHREACGAWPDNTQAPRPIGGRREACGAWPGFEPTRRAKLAARTASGRAGRAAAGDLSGQQTTSIKTAAHEHTKQPGPKAGPDGARNTSDTTQQHEMSYNPKSRYKTNTFCPLTL